MNKKKLILWASLLLSVSLQASSAIISYDFTGTLSTVNDTDNLLGGNLAIGDIFTGIVSYESNSPDGSSRPDYFTSSAEVELTARINNYTFTSIYSSVDLNSDSEYIHFVTGYESEPFIDLGSNSGRLITLLLSDSDNTIFENDYLPTSLNLSNTASTLFSLHGDTGIGGPTFSINGELTSLTTSTVPEPSTLAIFALGMMGLASRRFKKRS